MDEDKAKEEEIIRSLTKNVEFKGTNLWALIFAIFIASIGLNVNSTAVIIAPCLFPRSWARLWAWASAQAFLIST